MRWGMVTLPKAIRAERGEERRRKGKRGERIVHIKTWIYKQKTINDRSSKA
jgi:hypothetical protein